MPIRDLNSPLFRNAATPPPSITLKDIADCKGQSRSYLARIGSQLSTLWNKGTFVTDDHIKEVILKGDRGLLHDVFTQAKTAPLTESHRVIIEDLSDIIGTTARKMLEKMEVPVTDMVKVNDLRQAAEKAGKAPKSYRKLYPNASDGLYEIAMGIKTIYYRVKAGFIRFRKPESAEYYDFKAKRIEIKYNLQGRIRDLNLFKDQLVGLGINIMKSVDESHIPKLKRAKAELKEQVINQAKVIDPGVRIEDDPQVSLILDGICLGISIDLAENYFSLPEEQRSSHDLIRVINYEQGGNQRAEINQAAYDFKSFTSYDKAFKDWHELFANAKTQITTTLAHVLPDMSENRVKELRKFLTVDVLLRFLQDPKALEALQKDSLKFLLFPGKDNGAANQMNCFMYPLARVVNNADKTAWLKKTATNDLYIDYPLLQQAIIREIDLVFAEEFKKEGADKDYLLKRRQQLVGEVKFALAIEEFKATKKISDPFYAYTFKLLDNHTKTTAIANVRGLNLIPCTTQLGTHFNYKDDAGYLQNLGRLDKGFYEISIKTESAGHAVSLVINGDGSSHLFDPNVGTLYFKTIEEAKEGLLKLLSLYPVPDPSYHRIEFYRLEPIA